MSVFTFDVPTADLPADGASVTATLPSGRQLYVNAYADATVPASGTTTLDVGRSLFRGSDIPATGTATNATLFDPATGLGTDAIWVDFSDPANYTLTGSDYTSITSKGRAVTFDTAAAGGTLVQATANTINGARWQGGRALSALSVSGAQDGMYILAVVYDPSTGLGSGSEDAIDQFVEAIKINNATREFNYSPVAIRAWFGNGNRTHDANPANGAHVSEIVYPLAGSHSSISAYMDGVSIAASNTTNGSNTLSDLPGSVDIALGNPTGDTGIGNEGGGAEHTVLLLDFVIMFTPPTTTQREKLEGWAAHKHDAAFGTLALLPAAHPYKTDPPYV